MPSGASDIDEMYQVKPVLKSSDFHIHESNFMSLFDMTKKLMLNVTSIQNSNGSFRNNKTKTAYYIIAMLLYKDRIRPYRNQINKAISYLLNFTDNDLTIYLALKLAYTKGFRRNELNSIITSIEDKDQVGNYAYLFNLLINNVEEFSDILFHERMNIKQLINYLFKKI